MYHIEHLPRKNSRTYKRKLSLPDIQAVQDYCSDNNTDFDSAPYVFTHIRLTNGEIVTQTTNVNGHDFTLSPNALLKSFTAQV